MNRLNGLSGLITGAAGNIGRATALRCRNEGASVVLWDRRAEELNELSAWLLREAPDAPGRVTCQVVDVTDAPSVKATAAVAAETQGPLDFLFVNAGVEGPVQALRDYPDEAFRQVMEVNCTGAFHCVKYCEPLMPDGASILITSSVVGLKGSPKTVGYVTSKHAVVGLMRSAAKSYADRRVRVNSIHPGLVESDMLRRIETGLVVLGATDPRAAFLAVTPMGTTITPDDVANAAVFFFSGESRYVTGQTMAVDAGYLL